MRVLQGERGGAVWGGGQFYINFHHHHTFHIERLVLCGMSAYFSDINTFQKKTVCNLYAPNYIHRKSCVCFFNSQKSSVSSRLCFAPVEDNKELSERLGHFTFYHIYMCHVCNH